jgi:hypothetical protein
MNRRQGPQAGRSSANLIFSPIKQHPPRNLPVEKLLFLIEISPHRDDP